MGAMFVAGATGYTGQAVVREARRLGLDVVAHIRPDSPRLDAQREAFQSLGVSVDTTPWDEQKLAETLRAIRPHAVFSLLGTTQKRSMAARRRGGAEESYQTVDEGLTRMLLRASESSGVGPRFVYLSSEGAQGKGRSPYMNARVACERALAESDLAWVAARPCFITGADRADFRPMERGSAILFDVLLGAVGLLGMKRTRQAYRSITSEHLAMALISLALDPLVSRTAVSSYDLQERAAQST